MTPDLPRIPMVDIARTVALAAMVVFHFTFDLELFGFVAPGTTMQGLWWWWARATAGAFLVIVGLVLWLAHGRGIRWRTVWRRWLVVVAAAVLVSVATRLAIGDAYVRWGILHMIAAGSLLALPALALPWWGAAVAGAVVAAAPAWLAGPAFDGPWLLWLGLNTTRPFMVDYLPVLPWLAPVLWGVALAKVVPWRRLAWDGPWLRRLGWPGRHSLVIYLVHQPVLISLFWLFTTAF